MTITEHVLDRLATKVLVGDGCWEWVGARNRTTGYGRFQWKGRTREAHRAVYELLVGPIPEGLTIDHLCRNRGCAKPDHLEPVTSRENTLRGDTMAARHAAATHCPQGHPYDETNTRRSAGRRYCRACDRAR